LQIPNAGIAPPVFIAVSNSPFKVLPNFCTAFLAWSVKAALSGVLEGRAGVVAGAVVAVAGAAVEALDEVLGASGAGLSLPPQAVSTKARLRVINGAFIITFVLN
jgi:hypothetical protein